MKKIIMIMIASMTVMTNVRSEEIHYCDHFRDLTFRIMQARQEGLKLEHEPRNQMEHEMMLNVWQWPSYHGTMMKRKATKLFSDDWTYACIRGYYNVPETIQRNR